MSTLAFAQRYPWLATSLVFTALCFAMLIGEGLKAIGQTGQSLIANAGLDQTVPRFETGTLDASESHDLDGSLISYTWSLISAPSNSSHLTDPDHGLSDPIGLRPTFTPDRHGDYVFQLAVFNGVETITDEVIISTRKSPPVADLGDDIAVNTGMPIWIDPTRSFDDDGRRVGYGDMFFVSIPDGSTAIFKNRTFTPDVAGDYVVGMITNNQNQDSEVGTVTISTGNLAPQADAGDEQHASTGEQVSLNASRSSDANGDQVSFSWSFASLPAFSLASFDDPTSITPKFTVDTEGDYVAQLVVTDSHGARAGDTVVITTNNARPIARAGADQALQVGDSTVLDGGESSDGNDLSVNYRWTAAHRAGTTMISGDTSVSPTVIVSDTGLHVVQLVVDDGTLSSRPDNTVLAVRNFRPTAVISAVAEADTGEMVVLDAGQSLDLNSNGLTASWSLLAKPSGSSTFISNPAAITTDFNPDMMGQYIVQLIVTDSRRNKFKSPAITQLITVSEAANQPPVFNSTPITSATIGLTYVYVADAADPEGQDIVYSLDQFPAGMQIDSVSGMVSWVPDSAGSFAVTIRATDSDDAAATQTYTIAVAQPNQPPTFTSTPLTTANTGVTYTYDADANDPEGQIISYSLDTFPAGMSIDSGSGLVSWIADTDGTFQVDIRATDALGAFSTQSFSITVTTVNTNSPPILDAVGNLNVDLGSSLSFTLSASDPDGDPVMFLASPLPLPDGASLNSTTGEFNFQPGTGQSGTIQLTLIASDGVLTDQESVIITVSSPQAGDPTSISGRLLDTNDFVQNGTETPIAGATISILGSGVTTVTNSNGEFSLSGISAGQQVFDIDASTALPAPDGSSYTNFREALNIISSVNNIFDRPFFLSRLAPDSTVMVDPANTTILDVQSLDITLEIPPNTVKNPDGSDYTGPLSIAEIPNGLTPVDLPERFEPDYVISVQPAGLRFSQAANITIPNVYDLPPGGRINLWSFDPLRLTAILEATADGMHLASIQGGVEGTTWHGASQDGPDDKPDDEPDENDDKDKCCDQQSGSRTALRSGALTITHNLPSYQSVGVSRGLELVYDSGTAAPANVFSTTSAIQTFRPNQERFVTSLFVGGVQTPDRRYTTLAGSPARSIQRFVQSVQYNAGSLATGRYPFRLNLTQELDNTRRNTTSRISRIRNGKFLVHNRRNSVLGSGWGIRGINRLLEDTSEPDSLLLSQGNGSLTRFIKAEVGIGSLPETVILDETINGTDFAAPITADFDNDGNIDLAGIGFQEIIDPELPPGEGGFRIPAIVILPGNGAGGFAGALPGQILRGIPLQDPAGGEEEGPAFEARSLASGDFNGDNKTDLIATGFGGFRLYTNIAGGFFELSESFSDPNADEEMGGDGGSMHSVAVADFNADGNLDALFARSINDERNGATTELFVGDGTGALVFSQSLPVVDDTGFEHGADNILAADFNVDDCPDAAIRGQFVVAVLLGDCQGNFEIVISSQPGSPDQGRTNTNLVAVADFNQDNALDIASADANGTVGIAFGDGLGEFENAFSVANANAEEGILVGDFDNNGMPDLVAMRDNTQLGIIYNVGDGTGNPVDFPISANVISAAAADFNNDGLPDLALQQSNNNPRFEGLALLSNVPDPAPQAVFLSPDGDFSSVTQDVTGNFTRVLKDGTSEAYATGTGLLTSVTDRNGNQTTYAYDGQQRLTSINDPAGRVTSIAYAGNQVSQITDPANRISQFQHDADGNLTAIIDPDGSQRNFVYDAAGRMSSQISKRGLVTEYSFNASGQHTSSLLPDGSTRQIESFKSQVLIAAGSPQNPAPALAPLPTSPGRFTTGTGGVRSIQTNSFGQSVGRTDALGRSTRIARDRDGNVRSSTSPENKTTRSRYDERGNVVKSTSGLNTPEQRSVAFAYDPFSLLTRFEDGNGNVTSITRDPAGNPFIITDALLNTVTSTYNAQGLLETSTDQNNQTTAFAYDGNGNLATITNAEGEVTQISRDAVGNVSGITTGFGSSDSATSSFTYDNLNRVTSVTDGEGQISLFRYDASGNLIETEDATGVVITRGYDQLDRLISMSDPATGSTSLQRDNNGNITRITDTLGRDTQFVFDLENQLRSSTDALGGTTSFSYDNDGNLTGVTNARNATTVFEYDALNRRNKRINPLGQQTIFTYDNRDNITQVLDAKGQQLTSIYDQLNRLTQLTTPDNLLSFTYDDVGNILTANDNDSTLTFSYDAANRLLTSATGGIASTAATLTNVYNQRGLRTSLSDSFGGSQVYGYDGADRLASLITSSANMITFDYDAAGRATGIGFPNGTEMQAGYDLATGRLADLAHLVGAMDLSRFDYAYNTVGNITGIDESGLLGVRSRTFSYDELQRLTAGGTAAAPETYTYDSVGNRDVTHLSALHVVNAADRLTEDDQFTYSYDANGNLAAKTDKASSAITSYSWNAQNQLIQIDRADATSVNYAYDALGRRIQKNINGIVSGYIYDDEDIYLETDDTGALLARFAHGDRTDQPLSFERGDTDFYYHADHLGSIRQVTDSIGTVVNQYQYDGYGRFLTRTETIPQPYGFTAREQDQESSLYYYRARYYDPVSGRFASQDPIGFAAFDFNLYRYVFNSPVTLTDPSGAILPALAVAAIGRCALGANVGAGVATLGNVGGLVAAAGLESIFDAARDALNERRDRQNNTDACGKQSKNTEPNRTRPDEPVIDPDKPTDLTTEIISSAVGGCVAAVTGNLTIARAAAIGAAQAVRRFSISAPNIVF